VVDENGSCRIDSIAVKQALKKFCMRLPGFFYSRYNDPVKPGKKIKILQRPWKGLRRPVSQGVQPVGFRVTNAPEYFNCSCDGTVHGFLPSPIPGYNWFAVFWKTFQQFLRSLLK